MPVISHVHCGVSCDSIFKATSGGLNANFYTGPHLELVITVEIYRNTIENDKEIEERKGVRMIK